MKLHIRIILAISLLAFFAAIIWKPSITGQASSENIERVIVVLKTQANNGITGAIALDDSPATLEDMKKSTYIVQKAVLDDVNSASLIDSVLQIDSNIDVQTERELEFVPAMVVQATPKGIEELRAHPLVEAVYPNIMFDLMLNDSVPLINADDVWNLSINNNSVDGSNVSVCIIDTGISNHSAFQNRIVNQKCFCSNNCCPNGQSTDIVATDNHIQSHGTHVSGIIGANGQYKGVAPGVNIIAVKVCDSSCSLADIFSGIDYCLQVKNTYNVVAISGSIGDNGNYATQSQCPTFFDSAINAAYNAGIVNIFASGNNGFTNGISYPGCSPNAIAVGATDKSDSMASFTNRGALLEVLAPGLSITSTVSNNQYGSLTGTSQATPHVSGAVALIQHYALLSGLVFTPDNITNAFISTGVNIGGYPRINVTAALQSLINQTINVTNQTNNGSNQTNASNQTNTPPVLVISSPTQNSTIFNPVLLQGNASDAEDGFLNVTWSKNGTIIGTSSPLILNLALGNHSITLSATDSDNITSMVSVNFTVITQPNVTLVPVIYSPLQNASVSNPVSLQGNTSYVEQVFFPGTELVWKEGEVILGTGSSIVQTFPIGEHTVTLQAAESETSVTFSVNTCQINFDENANSGIDIGDFVLLLTKFAEESIPCTSTSSESFCTIELDRNDNGFVDIGDFVSLLTAHSTETMTDINGQPCF